MEQGQAGLRRLAAAGRRPQEVAFNIYRCVDGGDPVKLNATPINQITDFLDQQSVKGQNVQYFAHSVVGGKEGEPSEKASPANAGQDQTFVCIKLDGGYTFQKVGMADLNDDGKYDYVTHLP